MREDAMLHATFDGPLVAASVAISVAASYAGLRLAARIPLSAGSRRIAWVAGAGAALGISIWTMHFVGMLALGLGVAVRYDPLLTAASVGVAALASTAAIMAVTAAGTPSARAALAGAVLFAFGIGAAHHIGMAAIRQPIGLHHSVSRVVASLVVAFGASVAAFHYAFGRRDATASSGVASHLTGAALVAAAIAGTHYTAISAVHFELRSRADVATRGYPLDGDVLNALLAAACSLVIGVAVLIAYVDRRARSTMLVRQRALEHQVQEGAAEAQAATDLYRLLAENATDLISTHRPDGAFVYAAPSWAAYVGVEDGAMRGRVPAEFCHPDDVATVVSRHRRALYGDEHGTVVWRCRRADGSYGWLETAVRGVRDSSTHEVQTFVCTTRDISGRKELERLKDEFVSVVSHELRTPLTSIRGSLGLLASGQLANAPEKAQRMLDLAIANTDRLVRLINDILDVERIESGAIAMECAWCDGIVLAHQVVEALRPVADRAGVDLRVHGRSSRLWGDADRIIQTLTNLVGNAVKFSPRGSAVDLDVRRLDHEVRFAVRDRGRGIPPDKLETIFERFQQVDASDAREKGGTGLGLAISRSIVRQHGGAIWAESPREGGSVFTFTLPVPSAPRDPAAAPSARKASLGPTRILVIEDDEALAQVITTALEARGFLVALAHDGASAIAHCHAGGSDVLVVDLALPDIDGLDVLDRVTERGRLTVPAIIYTATDPGAAARARIRTLGVEIATKGRVSTDDLVERVVRLAGGVPAHPLATVP